MVSDNAASRVQTAAMNALVPSSPIPSSVPASLTDAEIDATLSFAEQEKSAGTRRAYRSDWRIFSAWRAARDLEPLPATPEPVARFQATAGVRTSTISRRCAAIGYAHKLAGHREPPSNAETVRAVMRGIRRSIGTASAQKAPATAELIGQMLKHCPDDLKGTRDRALLALGAGPRPSRHARGPARCPESRPERCCPAVFHATSKPALLADSVVLCCFGTDRGGRLAVIQPPGTQVSRCSRPRRTHTAAECWST